MSVTNENKPQNFENMDPYIFITQYLIKETKPNAKILVCIKPNNPKDNDPWIPTVVSKSTVLPSSANLYISISSCEKVNDTDSPNHGQYRNKLDCAVQTHLFMLDDLGDDTTPNKPDYTKLPIQPTWVIETSPHNYQALYVLTEPLDNIPLANRISKQLPGQARSDKSSVNAVRWARLPFGVNNKPEHCVDGEPFQTHIEQGNPDTTYHASEIIDAFDLELSHENIKPQEPVINDKPLQVLEGWERHVSALCAISPDCDYQTWFNVACVLHPWGESGLQAFIAWSQSSDKHKLSDAELTRKFNDVEYDILNPKGRTSIVSWPWLEARARENGWDYDAYSSEQTKELIAKINEVDDLQDLENIAPAIYDAFLAAPDFHYVITTMKHRFGELGETITIPEIRAIINNPKKIKVDDECWTYPLTDEGNLERFHVLYKGMYYFVPELNKHLIWEGDNWEIDPTSQGAAINTINHITRLERKPLNEVQIKALNRWRTTCGQYGHINSLTSLIRKDKELRKSLHEFNANPTRLGLPIQILNLENNVISDNIPENFITLKTRFSYNEEATCPRWEQFISEIMNGNKKMIRFLQILAGYALFGENPEQIFVILNGGGSNGKSTFVNTLEYIMGDYATTTNPSTLTRPPFGRAAGSAAPDLMRLFQKRLVLCNEWEENTYLNESLIKALTGGSDPISVRGLYANEYLTYTPSYLLMLATNHIPKIVSMDYGIWRRLIIVPFEVNFDDAQHKSKKDTHLYDHFKAQEAQGIFKWMIEGYRMWREITVIDAMPQQLIDVKQDFKREMDTIGEFINECCIIDEPKTRVKSADLYRAYQAWCVENGNKPKSNKAFSSNILDRGHKRVRIGTVNAFDQIRLLTLSELAEQNRLLINEEQDQPEMRIN